MLFRLLLCAHMCRLWGRCLKVWVERGGHKSAVATKLYTEGCEMLQVEIARPARALCIYSLLYM